MKDTPSCLTRRSLLHMVPLGIAGSVFLHPTQAHANFIGFVFELLGFGFARTLFTDGLGAAILETGLEQVLSYGMHSTFGQRPSGYGNYSYGVYTPNGWTEHTPSKRTTITISCKPTDRIPGDVLRILAIEYNLLKRDGIVLPHGGRLVIEEDGKMQFVNTKFRGYAYMQNNRDLTVWTQDHRLVLTRAPRNGKLHTFHQDSDNGHKALTSLLGEMNHV